MSESGALLAAFMEYHKYKVKALEDVLAEKVKEIAVLRADLLEAERAKPREKKPDAVDAVASVEIIGKREDPVHAAVSVANGKDDKRPSDFDVVPKVHDYVPPYKCKVPAPRTKKEKAALPGQSCECCEDYFNSFPENERQKRMNESSKHRSRYSQKPPKTPEKYWDLSYWPPSPEAANVGPLVTKRRRATVLKIVPYDEPK